MAKTAVIVPSYNRPAALRECLRALVAQDVEDFEVIVVDDGSATPLTETCAEFAPLVRCIRQENAGPAQARNRGVEATSAPFVAFTDDDCRPEPGWLSAMMQAHGDVPWRMVGGHVVNGLPGDPYASASQAICDYLYHYFGAREGRMPWFTSNSIACRRVDFLELGGFDKVFERAAAEDRDLGMRWRERGGDLVFAEDAVILHYHASSLGHFYRQHAHYGSGALFLHRLLAERGSAPIKTEPPGFYIGLMLWPLSQHRWRGIGLVPLMALSQIAMVNGFLRTSARVE